MISHSLRAVLKSFIPNVNYMCVKNIVNYKISYKFYNNLFTHIVATHMHDYVIIYIIEIHMFVALKYILQ